MLNNILESSLRVYESLSYTGGWMWLVNIIKGIMSVCVSMGAGIILFTFILKAITLPLDIFSRVSMRKNSLKMKEMRPQLEKLQKQYAGDKKLYQQKMAALYKKNGYSMLGGCLPTIVTLVFFIIALTGFNKYSVYQNTQYFSDMCLSYSSIAYENFVGENFENIKSENGEEFIVKISEDNKELFINNDMFLNITHGDEGFYKVNTSSKTIDVEVVYESNDGEVNRYIIYDLGGYLKAKYNFVEKEEEETQEKCLKINGQPAFIVVDERVEKDEDYKLWLQNRIDSDAPTENNTPKHYLETKQRAASAKEFRDSNEGFLWVKNIWIADSPMQKVVYGNASSFKKSLNIKNAEITDEFYDELTYDLAKEKKQVNGYFIMVILVIGTSVLSQWVMSRSQKDQLELQSVDGSGAKQQKMMMIIMPIIMAIFAFMYTAAFSIYIIFSSVFSLASTIIINKCVDIWFNRKKNKVSLEGDKRVRSGEVIVQEVEYKEKDEEKEVKNKKDKKSHKGKK